MKYQAKVNQTQKYSDNQSEHIVCEGKLVLLKNKKPPADIYVNNRGYHPIIISETEYIKVGDLFYYCSTNEIEEANSEQAIDTDVCKKVLALPENFSDKHLQAIKDGKMKHGNEVLVECEDAYEESYGEVNGIYIHLNQQNHITLFPAKQSLEEAAEEWYQKSYFKAPDSQDSLIELLGKKVVKDIWKEGAKWQQENN